MTPGSQASALHKYASNSHTENARSCRIPGVRWFLPAVRRADTAAEPCSGLGRNVPVTSRGARAARLGL